MPLPAKSLFDLYQSEKTSLDDITNPFPTFGEWKDTYQRERQEEMDSMDISDVYLMDDDDTNHELDVLSNPTHSHSATPPTKTGSIPSPKPARNNTKPLTNMDKARTIYQTLFEKSSTRPSRKETMDAFISSLGISKACASTYEYNIKQKYTK